MSLKLLHGSTGAIQCLHDFCRKYQLVRKRKMRSIRSGQSCAQGESNSCGGIWGLLVVRVVEQTASMRPEKLPLGAGTASKMANGKREGWEIRNCFATAWADLEEMACVNWCSVVCQSKGTTKDQKCSGNW